MLSHEELLPALHRMLDDETARVRGAEPVLGEDDGWRARTGGLLHRTGWDAEAWRWFELVDLAVVDEVVVIAFRWLDPATPELTYSTFAHVDGIASADAAAAVVRQTMRRLLLPGWRERVDRTWLGGEKVLVARRRATEEDPHRAALRRRVDELLWSTPRGGPDPSERVRP